MAAYGQEIDDTGIIWPGAFGLMLKNSPDPIEGWMLDGCINLKPWIGRKVRVRGSRYYFNGMIVRSIEPIDGLPPPKVPWKPWQVLRLTGIIVSLLRKITSKR